MINKKRVVDKTYKNKAKAFNYYPHLKWFLIYISEDTFYINNFGIRGILPYLQQASILYVKIFAKKYLS